MAYPLYDFDPRNLPSELHAAIGLAITNFAQTEEFVQEAIAGCLGVDFEYGKAVTIHMAMPLRFSVLRSVAEIRIDDLDVLDELDHHIEQIEECVRRRNIIAHRQWCRHPETGQLFTLKEGARARLEIDLLPMKIEKVLEDADFIYDAGMAFFQFIGMLGLMPIIPDEARPRAHKSKEERKKRKKTGKGITNG